MNDFVSKPVDPDALHRAIGKALVAEAAGRIQSAASAAGYRRPNLR